MSTNNNQLKKKDVERLVSQNSTSISYQKPNETMQSRISKYWSTFSQIYISDVKQDYIICDDCKTILVYKSSTGSGCMINHLRSCKSKMKKGYSSDEQSMIHKYYNTVSNNQKNIPTRIKRAITMSCAEFVAEDGRAFQLIQGPGFVQLAKQLFDSGRRLSSSINVDIEDLLPDPTTISRHIDKMYDDYKQQLIKFCKSMNSFCVSVDFWCESFTGLSYCGISLSHIDRNFKSYTFSIGCFPYEMENKRAPTIRSFVDDVLKTFDLTLDQEKFVVTDNEPTMLCTFNAGCKRIGCSDHYINKQLQHTFTTKMIDGTSVDCDLVQELFNNVKTIVSNIRRTHKQQNLSKKLVLYSDTRFSGAYVMLNVFSSVFDELIPVLDSKLSSVYSHIDEYLLLDICRFLSSFDTALQALSDDKRPTLHRVLPFKQYLIKKCETNLGDSEGMKQVKSFLHKRLDEKWKLTDEHFIAAVLHPNNKHLHKNPEFKEKAMFLLKQEMYKRHDSCLLASSAPVVDSTIASSTSSPSSISISKSTHLDARNILLMEVFDKPPPVPEKHDVEKELENYLTSTIVMENDGKDDILLFWKQNSQSFPCIASIARDILAIPASNTSVERQFSSCKNTITDKRTKLGSEKLNKLIFLKKNMNILKKFSILSGEECDRLNTKRKHDTIILNDEKIQKKTKETDLYENQCDNECVIDIESEDDDEIF